jgi:transcription antitermination factor NusG
MSQIHDIDAGSKKQEARIWIALYARARHEVQVSRQISEMGIETFVPLRKEIHRWSDRKKWVDVPLIPSYVFVHIDLRDYFRVFLASGIVRVVMFRGRIARIRDNEIELLRCAVEAVEPIKVATPEYHAMDDVVVVSGLFAGHRGKVVQSGSKYKINIRIEELESAVVIELPKADIWLANKAVAVF